MSWPAVPMAWHIFFIGYSLCGYISDDLMLTRQCCRQRLADLTGGQRGMWLVKPSEGCVTECGDVTIRLGCGSPPHQ